MFLVFGLGAPFSKRQEIQCLPYSGFVQSRYVLSTTAITTPVGFMNEVLGLCPVWVIILGHHPGPQLGPVDVAVVVGVPPRPELHPAIVPVGHLRLEGSGVRKGGGEEHLFGVTEDALDVLGEVELAVAVLVEVRHGLAGEDVAHVVRVLRMDERGKLLLMKINLK